LVGAGDDGVLELVAKERREGLGELARDRAVLVIDEQPREEREVELTPHCRRGFAVGGLAVANPSEGPLEVGLGCLEVCGCGVKPAFGGWDLGSDAFVLALE
jgi:hypothetical protein